MAFKPKKGVITGTKKADKIIWASSWKQALTVNGGAGNDIINFKKSKYKNKLNGDAGNDKIYGGTKADAINGGAGSDKLYGYAGNDSITAGAGNDVIYGGKGNDIIKFTSGNNTAVFAYGDGNDVVYAGKGKDTLQFLTQKNVKYMKENLSTVRNGNDLVIYHGYNAKTYEDYTVKLKNFFTKGTSVTTFKAKDGKTISLSSLVKGRIFYTSGTGKIVGTKYNDQIYGGVDADQIYAGKGNDDVYGQMGDDIIYGQYGNNTLNGGWGDDIIYGGTGNDVIYGEYGDDTIDVTAGTAKKGANTLYGGDGDDTYKVNLGQKNVIYDSAGASDTVEFNETKGKMHFVFNVNQEGTVDAKGLRVLDDTQYATWKANALAAIDCTIIGKDSKGVGSWDAVDAFEDSNGEVLSMDAIATVKGEIASWLATANDGDGYDDVAAALKGKAEDVTTLIAKFDSIQTQWINPGEEV